MGKIYTLTDLDEFLSPNPNWGLTINISDIWTKYKSNQLTLDQFNKLYAERLIQNKPSILKLNQQAWVDIEGILPKLTTQTDINESINVYDEIYDWGDKNDVEIKTK